MKVEKISATIRYSKDIGGSWKNRRSLKRPWWCVSHVEPPTPSEPTLTPRPHWCEEHQAEFKRQQKAGVIFPRSPARTR